MQASTSKKYVSQIALEFIKIFENCEKQDLSESQVEKYLEWGYTTELNYRDDDLENYSQAIEYSIQTVQDWLDSGSTEAMVKKTVTAIRKEILALYGLQTSKKPRDIPIIARTFKAPSMMTANVNATSKANRAKTKTVLASLETVNKIVKEAYKLLVKTQKIENNSQAFDVAIALSFVTGRRIFSEISKSAVFIPKTENTLTFSGQAKNASKIDKPYQIYSLIDSQMVCEKHDLLLDYLLDKKWFALGECTEGVIQSRLGRVSSKLLSHFSQVLEYELTPHDLRKLYAAMCFRLYSKSNSFSMFAGELLGHGKHDFKGTYISDSETTNSYVKFRLI